MGLISLLYISRSVIAPSDSQRAVNDIVTISQTRNSQVNITGALLFTGTYFAQVLEGERADVDALVEMLRRDPRHINLVVVDRSPLANRRFASWSLAYFGPSLFVKRHVTHLLKIASSAEHERAVDWLIEVMHEFSIS